MTDTTTDTTTVVNAADILESVDSDGVTGAGVDLTLTVEVPRERMWELIADQPRYGEWSPECTGATWLDEADQGVGARFTGHNRFPDGSVNSVSCVVTETARPSVFAWVVLDDKEDPERPGSVWRYELEPGVTPGTTRVRHTFVHGPGNTGAREGARRGPGELTGRLTRLRTNMKETITAMAREGAAAKPAREPEAGSGTMKYLLLICEDGPIEAGEGELDAGPWVEEMESRGIRQLGNRVRPAESATTVRVRGGELLVTDGPFAETKEQMAGFDVIECADLDEAVEVAAKHPMARFGMIEVRPFWQE